MTIEHEWRKTLAQYRTRLYRPAYTCLTSSFQCVCFFIRLESNRFRTIVRNLLQFISIRQFPAGERGLPAPTRSRWWIPTAVRILALLSMFVCVSRNFIHAVCIHGCHCGSKDKNNKPLERQQQWRQENGRSV